MSMQRWGAAFLVAIFALLLLLHLSGSGEEFSRYNQNWNGTSRFFEMVEGRGAVGMHEAKALDAHRNAILIVPLPEAPNEEEIVHYRAFLERGNTMVVLGKGNETNGFLSGLGSRIRVSTSGVLLSLDSRYPTPASVIGFRKKEDPLLVNVSSIVLNHPAALEGGEALYVTSVLSWIDTNGDMRVNADEGMRSYPVAVREGIGGGTLLVVGDPSLLLNGMIEARVNEGFWEAIFSKGEHVLVDQAHSGCEEGGGPLLLLRQGASTTVIKTTLVSVFILLAVFFFWRRGYGRR